MSTKSDVAPATLSVRLADGGVVVEYVDGREVFYHGVPKPVEDDLVTPPGKDVHVLVTDEDGTEGVLLYVDDRLTSDDILRDTGVGRVLLADGDSVELFPGVVAIRDGLRHEVRADPSVVDGRVFVFVEDEFGEASYEIVPEADAEADADTDAEGEADTDADADADVEAEGSAETADADGEGGGS